MAKIHHLPRARWWHQWPLISVLLCVSLSLMVVALDEFRIGSLLLAGSVIWAFLLRLTLSNTRAGLLMVRSRSIDLAVLGTLGLLLAVFAVWVPAPS